MRLALLVMLAALSTVAYSFKLRSRHSRPPARIARWVLRAVEEGTDAEAKKKNAFIDLFAAGDRKAALAPVPAPAPAPAPAPEGSTAPARPANSPSSASTTAVDAPPAPAPRAAASRNSAIELRAGTVRHLAPDPTAPR